MIALTLAFILASGPGAHLSAGRASTPVLLPSSRDVAANNRTLSSIVATFNGTVESLNWTQSVAGIDGIGGGNNVFRVSVLVDEVSVCHLDVACDAVAGQDYVTTCESMVFLAGQDVDVRITSMPCLGAPTGFQTTNLAH